MDFRTLLRKVVTTVISEIYPKLLELLLEKPPLRPVTVPVLPPSISFDQYVERAKQTIVCARTGRQLDPVHCINWAIVGMSGVGKSTLINALRALKDDDALAACTGETETTQSIISYEVPGHSHLVLWDLPGGGTPKHPSVSYFMDKNLLAYDGIILAYTRGSGTEFLDVAKTLATFQKPVTVVRTRADIDIASKMRRGFSEDSARDELRRETQAELRQALGVTVRSIRCFLVSAWDLQEDRAKNDEYSLCAFLLESAASRVAII